VPRSLGYPSLAVFALVLACAVNAVYSAPAAHAAPLALGPTTIVALGDSAASGEGGGDYEAGTRGENGDWCHRSRHAYVEQTRLAQDVVNLACSGATSANVGFGTAVHNTEGSQAQQLIGVARTHRVTVVVAQFGANDDPGFGQSVVRCVVAYLQPSGPGCADELASQWPSRLAAMQPKAVAALNDVRSAMRQAGYADTDYVLVVASYASPVTESMVTSHGWTGCPFRRTDAQWGRTKAVPQLSEALRQVAGQVGARFLDLSRATEGHEACTSAGPEWVRHLTVDTRSFAREGFAAVRHLAQESFHPNVIGYAQQAGCLSEFVRAGAASAQCVIGSDGRLHAVGAAQLAPAALGR
jgi:lysophospholipase L1-like esterase